MTNRSDRVSKQSRRSVKLAIRFEQAEQQAKEERQRTEQQQRAERLAAHLRSLGIDPDTLT